MEQQNQQPNQPLAQTSLDETKRQKSRRIKIVFLALVAVLLAVGVILFLWPPFKIDTCLDHGGAWDYENSRCITIQSTTESREPCDLDNDKDCDGDDYYIFIGAVRFCRDAGPEHLRYRYNPLADANHDGCVTLNDEAILFPERETANWQTYRNDEFGFEFQYPSDWNLKNLQDSIVLTPIDQQSQGAQSGAILWVSAFPLEKEQDFKEILINNTTQGECSDCHPSIDEFTVIQVGNSSFYYIFHYLSEGQFGVLYYKIGSRSVIRLGLTATTVANNWLEQALNETYDVKKEPSHIFLKEILSTFRFVKDE